MMKFRNLFIVVAAVSVMFFVSDAKADLSFAGGVVSYEAGVGYTTGWAGDYTNSGAALGQMATDTGSWGGTVYYTTPYNNPYTTSDFASVGVGGHITLELENYAIPQASGPEIGVFSYQQFLWDYGTDSPTSTLQRVSQKAMVEVSEYGSTWVALNGGSDIAMNVPGNAWNNAASTDPADFGIPYVGDVGDFAGVATLQDAIDVYGGSACGNWLDISGTGLAKVGYVRFSVADGDAFDLNSLTLASDAIGGVVPEPATLLLLGLGGLVLRSRKS